MIRNNDITYNSIYFFVHCSFSSRLYVKGKVLGYKRSKVNQNPLISLVKLEGVQSKEEAVFYCGKRVAFVYKSNTFKLNTKFRCIWGKVTRAHGTSGVVRAKFHKNLPPFALGTTCRIMLYP